MSWAEVKKINTDLKTPLNHFIWLGDYKAYGQSSYVFNDKDILHELYRNSILTMNDNAIKREAFDYIVNNDIMPIGKLLASFYKYRSFPNLASIDNYEDLLNNEDVINAICADTDFLNNYFLASNKIMNDVNLAVQNNPSSYLNKPYTFPIVLETESIMPALFSSKDIWVNWYNDPSFSSNIAPKIKANKNFISSAKNSPIVEVVPNPDVAIAWNSTNPQTFYNDKAFIVGASQQIGDYAAFGRNYFSYIYTNTETLVPLMKETYGYGENAGFIYPVCGFSNTARAKMFYMSGVSSASSYPNMCHMAIIKL